MTACSHCTITRFKDITKNLLVVLTQYSTLKKVRLSFTLTSTNCDTSLEAFFFGPIVHKIFMKNNGFLVDEFPFTKIVLTSFIFSFMAQLPPASIPSVSAPITLYYVASPCTLLLLECFDLCLERKLFMDLDDRGWRTFDLRSLILMLSSTLGPSPATELL